ncbi:MAG: helix-turn-helix transcriptional regulator [Oscillospiraceae bacterium]|jgi:transcriptional regulator with XRE-family HTH domain|nr:helix-turn-helix transcriptional regulator [Oscillospiraceae bacterium]
MEYYEKLKAIREDQDMTQQEVAEALRTTRQQISKYENGTQLMTIGRLRELCRLYKVSSDYILGLPRGLDWPRE